MLITLVFPGCATRPRTVERVDLKRYAGHWHEIGRTPNWFQRRCARASTADYALREDGRVSVLNRCRDAQGGTIRVEGTATPVADSGNAKLKVRFSGSPFAGDYWILGLDEKNYSWALVGHPSRWFLWILARSPSLPPETLRHITAIAGQNGYRIDRIQYPEP